MNFNKKNIFFVFVVAVLAVIGLFLLIQLIPVSKTNPAAVTQVQWDSQQTKALWDRACADCHSNETVWPWYANVAPVSWLVARDVNEGREHFNISDLNAHSHREHKLTDEIKEKVSEGEMPMGIYVMMHPTANLTDAEKQALIDGLQATLANFVK